MTENTGSIINNTAPTCPYCSHRLEKKPGRKKKCPYCSNLIYVKTRPSDKQQVLVTQEEAEQIEEQWSIINGTHDQYIAAKQEFQKERAILRDRFGQDPSDNDIRWSLLNKKMFEHARLGNWGLFRNAKFDMAEILRKECKLKDALGMYLEVCYLDLNGPRNMGGITDSVLLKEFPPWDPKDPTAELAPGIIKRISRMIQKTNIDREVVESMHMQKAKLLKNTLCLSLSPSDAWREICKVLFEKMRQ